MMIKNKEYRRAEVCGNAQVYDKASVFEEAFVCSNAKIYGKSKVRQSAEVTDYTEVYDCAEVLGYLSIGGYSKIRGSVRVNLSIHMSIIYLEASSENDYAVFKNTWSDGRYFIWTRFDDMWNVDGFKRTAKEVLEMAYVESRKNGDMYKVYIDLVENVIKKN